MTDCEICSIQQNTENQSLLLDGKYWQATLSSDQQYLARCFVTLKKHKQRLSELSEDEFSELRNFIGKLENAIDSLFSPTNFNWSCLMNDAVGLEQETHIHWHFIPRYKEPVTFMEITFIDKRWPKSARDLEPINLDKMLMNNLRDVIKSKLYIIKSS